jgi:ribosomal-protein-alanine N-acetyltransferase
VTGPPRMSPLDDLQTAGLRLTRIHADDLDDLVHLDSDPQVMATLGGIRSADETAEFLGRQLTHWTAYGFGWWLMRERLTGRFVGRGGLRHVTVNGRGEIEVGYALLPEFWGRGLATELTRESVRVAFVELHAPDLVAFTLPTNRASRRVMEKAGFHYEGDIVHADLPHVLYRLTAITWAAQSPDDRR